MAGDREVYMSGYRWVSSGGQGACPQCAELHGQVFVVNPGPGENDLADLPQPPLHPHCRCTVVEIMHDLCPDMGEYRQVAGHLGGVNEDSPYPDYAPYIKGGEVGIGNLVWGNNGRAISDGPVYELYGGKNWTAGRNPLDPDDEGAADPTPADDMDAAFARHDEGYDREENEEADRRLLAELEALPQDSDLWEKPPRNKEYAKAYLKRAIYLFKGKVYLWDMAKTPTGDTGFLFDGFTEIE